MQENQSASYNSVIKQRPASKGEFAYRDGLAGKDPPGGLGRSKLQLLLHVRDLFGRRCKEGSVGDERSNASCQASERNECTLSLESARSTANSEIVEGASFIASLHHQTTSSASGDAGLPVQQKDRVGKHEKASQPYPELETSGLPLRVTHTKAMSANRVIHSHE